ncbi:glycosyltransferase family 25 protein [Shewanella maritima]|uniref:Glycosyltransferase family 25 protein n=1 Tax=Shewanella maritima TaxID=2520507 RepID=A0A411PI53_9GAMM|nr:glycosyltransferase family 25 protein [Shewanella maritima]QBF83154.1 glycosyltransferase family 25 protein [Shewanella maritima]
MHNFKVFVINLASSAERLKHITEQLGKFQVPFERIDAVDGRKLSDEEIEKYSPQSLVQQHYFRPLNKGEVGCSLSHQKAWQKILDDDLDFAIILEDDIYLKDNFKSIVELMAELPTMDWDYIKLFPFKKGGESNVRDSIEYKGHRFVSYHKYPISAVGQIISRRGAQALIKNMPYVVQPVDGHIKSWWELDITPFGLSPYCIGIDVDGQSDINPGQQELNKLKQRKVHKILLNWKRAFNRMLATPKLDKAFNQFKQQLK